MRFPIHAAALTTLTSSLFAQVIEIPSMTVDTSTVNMSGLPVGNTTLSALITAGSNGGAPLNAVTLAQSTAQNGLYNTNTQLGRALVRSTTGSLAIIHAVDILDPQYPANIPESLYAGCNATFDLSVRANEFGVAIGDWTGGMIIEFRERTTNALVASTLSSNYTQPNAKFFRSQLTFDRVVVRCASPDGNFVIPQLHFQTAPAWAPFGVGCAGPDGIPVLSLVAPPRINNTFSLAISNMTPTGGAWVVATGASVTDSGLGPLPASLDVIGAPGCLLFCSVEFYTFGFHSNGTAQFDFALPNNPQLVGQLIANQALTSAPGANALGAVASNAGAGVIR